MSDTTHTLARLHAALTEMFNSKRQTRVQFMAEHGMADIHPQHLTRWLAGDIRAPYVVRLLRLTGSDPDVAAAELADRLHCPVVDAQVFAAWAAIEGTGIGYLMLARALTIDPTAAARWCAIINGGAE